MGHEKVAVGKFRVVNLVLKNIPKKKRGHDNEGPAGSQGRRKDYERTLTKAGLQTWETDTAIVRQNQAQAYVVAAPASGALLLCFQAFVTTILHTETSKQHGQHGGEPPDRPWQLPNNFRQALDRGGQSAGGGRRHDSHWCGGRHHEKLLIMNTGNFPLDTQEYFPCMENFPVYYTHEIIFPVIHGNLKKIRLPSLENGILSRVCTFPCMKFPVYEKYSRV